MALVAAAIADFHGAGHEAARASAQQAIDFASTSGLGEYHGIAPALAIVATTAAEAEHAVVLARRAATKLGLVFVLTLAGDVLLGEGSDAGSELLDEARQVTQTCADPGIALPLLDRVAGRHHLSGARPSPTTGIVEQLSERETAVLRYLPSTLSLPEIARELYVSPNTVKTQCTAIYRKLAVTSRQAAVQAAREHGLL
jgi:DNA-binding CsgD family transcriptional regulator